MCAAISTGLLPDGTTKYYREDDLMRGTSIKLGNLPPGDIPLMLDPKHRYNSTFGDFNGPLVPIYCSRREDKLVYKCRHPLTFDKETGLPTAVEPCLDDDPPRLPCLVSPRTR